MSSEKPHIVIVMGSFQLPWHYRFLKSSLEDQGYDATIVNLRSTILEGSTPIPDSLLADIEAVRTEVTKQIDSGHDVVLLAHSQGGVAAQVALEGLGKTESKAGVTYIVWLSCFLIEPGISGIEKAQGNPPSWLDVRDGLQILNTSAKEILYNDVPDALADEAAKYIYPNCHNVNNTVITYAAWNDIPSTYVLCEKDQALYPPVQEWVISSCELPSEILRLDASHSPFLSMPEKVAAIVRRAAGEKDVDLEGVKFGGVVANPNAKAGWEDL